MQLEPDGEPLPLQGLLLELRFRPRLLLHFLYGLGRLRARETDGPTESGRARNREESEQIWTRRVWAGNACRKAMSRKHTNCCVRLVEELVDTPE